VARDLSYLDFDVLLERGDQGAYRARVVNAPAGQAGPVAFAVPFTPLDLEIFVLRIGRPRRVVRALDAPETAAIKAFGGRLYRALFHDELEVNLLRSLSEATAKGAGLRIRLRLSDTPELAELPWEFLYDQTRNRFLGLSDRTPLVRFLEVPDPPRPLPVRPPLQILGMIASPSDYPRLDVEQEWTKLRAALAPLEQDGQVNITRLESASLAALRQRLRRADCHVLHFVGHGGFDPHTQDGVLVLEDQTGRGRLISGQDLGVLLHDHDPLRLVVLNACEGARADPSDPFAGTAQSLIQQGIPAAGAAPGRPHPAGGVPRRPLLGPARARRPPAGGAPGRRGRRAGDPGRWPPGRPPRPGRAWDDPLGAGPPGRGRDARAGPAPARASPARGRPEPDPTAVHQRAGPRAR
jgi:CHAT domain